MNIHVHYYVKVFRKEAGLTVRELAEKSSVSSSQISDIETGKSDPTVPTLCLLASALDVHPVNLFSYSITS